MKISKTPLLTGSTVDDKREEIKHYFHQTWDLYEALFDTITNHKAYFLKSEPLRHPLIFYFGHTASFFVNKLVLAKALDQRVNERFESMFAIGVDEMSWDDLNEDHYDWPAVSEVQSYRNQVKELIDSVISSMALALPIQQDSIAWLILMGIEHERIHLETSSVIIRMLPLEYLACHSLWKPCRSSGPAPINELLPMPARKLALGKPNDEQTYGWDNEYGYKQISIEEFKVSSFLVSNEEYLEFVQAGGYTEHRYWTEEGARWLEYTKAQLPRFWSLDGDTYYQRNMFEQIELPLNWPVEVNYLEAKAFCNWKSEITGTVIRLPIEGEWYSLREMLDTDQPYWKQAPGNINLEYFASSCPVDQFETNGIFDIIGNVWQWTETLMDGFPGFKVHGFYDDFSTPTFDGQHNLIKGGSWISTGNEATKYARYAFRRHFFQHAGFRYVQSQSADLPIDNINIYETDALISQYLEFHYGSTYFDVANYPVNCVDACMNYIKQNPKERAMDLGCSVGRATFELAKYFDHVDGIDFSARFIQHGVQLKKEGQVRFTIPIEGELVEYKEINLVDLDYDEIKHKVDFVQGDACNLKPMFRNYDLVFCGNLLDRLYDPALFLKSIAARVNPNGFLILTSPYTWLQEYTDKARWLGGIKVNGENNTTLDGLEHALETTFKLVDTREIPFVIRETARKFQHTVAQMTVWQKMT